MALINAKNSRFYALLLGMGLSFGLSMLTLGLWMPYTNHHAAWAVLVSGVGWALGVMVSGPARKLAGNIFWFAVDFSRGDFERTAHPPR
ncbi:MAG: hypothetical protein HYZ51_04745 [Candidatus Doudnabacteria bacterium]|nr:hypothetical protein [Candidatus Doudnabacteria bacterium]